MRTKKYPVALLSPERDFLKRLLRKGKQTAWVTTRARVLLMSDKGTRDDVITMELEVSPKTVFNVRQRFYEGGLDRALYDAPRPGQPPKLNGHEEAKVVAIACTTPPEGRNRWTLDLLTTRIRGEIKKIGRSTVHHVLLKNKLKPWREKNVVHS